MHGWKLIVVLLVCSVAIVGSIAPASAEETAELTIDLSTDESFVPPSGTRPLESEPFISRSRVTVATIDHATVRRERQSLDISGHYSRPDVTKLYVNRERLSTVQLSDE